MLLSLQNVSFYLGDAVHFSSVQSLSLVQFFATTWIMASGPIISWEIDGETVETVTDFIFLGSKITAVTICSDLGAPKKQSLTLFPLFPHLFPMK